MKLTLNSSTGLGNGGADVLRTPDSPTPPRSFLQKLHERAAASRFFTVSLLIHMVIIIVGGGVVLVKKMAEPVEDFRPVPGEKTALIPPEEKPKGPGTLEPPAPKLNVPDIAVLTSKAPLPTFEMAKAEARPILPPIGTAEEKHPTAASDRLPGLPDTMKGREGGKARDEARIRTGGTKAGEEAVLRGLNWLVKTQNSDGSWSARQHQAAMTGFALLSFLGHGETPVSPKYGPTVGRTIEWVLANGRKYDGRLSMEPAISQHGAYAHGIVTYALGEYCTMTQCQDERAVALFRQAVKYIVDGQGPDGGWMYRYDKSASDTSVTGWQIQALKAAHLTGLKIEGVDAALNEAMKNLKRVQGPKGGFGYRAAADTYSLTGVGVLGTWLWKQDSRDRSVTEGMKFMQSQWERHPVEYKHAAADLYAWYYNTQASLLVGEPYWPKWNGLFRDVLIKSQAADGSWPAMTAGSHDNLQKDEQGAGPYYRTNLCILMLEVYYRYSPSSK